MTMIMITIMKCSSDDDIAVADTNDDYDDENSNNNNNKNNHYLHHRHYYNDARFSNTRKKINNKRERLAEREMQILVSSSPARWCCWNDTLAATNGFLFQLVMRARSFS